MRAGSGGAVAKGKERDDSDADLVVVPARELAGSPAIMDFTEYRPFRGRRLQEITRGTTSACRSLGLSIPGLIEEERRYGHGFLFVPVAIGCGATIWFSLSNDPWLWPWIIAAVALSILAVASSEGVHRILALVMGLMVAGMLLAQLEIWRRSTIILDAPVTTDITGVVERSEAAGMGRTRYVIRLKMTANPQLRRAPHQISVVARGNHIPLAIGSGIAGRVRLSPPSGPALPSLHDFSFSAYFDGIGAVGYFYRAPTPASSSIPDDRVWLEKVERQLFELRAQIGNRIRQTVPGDAGAFAAAIVTDERRAISEDTVEALRVSGLAHIVAISGLNMALAAGIFFVGMRSLLALFPAVAQSVPTKKIAAFGALLMVTGYYLISGFGVSAQRAYIMMAVMLVAVILDRPSISLRNVALSAIIILVMNPSEILGPSFQMSFAATAALVAGYAVWANRTGRRQTDFPASRHPLVISAASLWHFTVGIALTSLIGSLSTAMFSIEHFHRIAMHGLAANLAAMPIISFVVMPAGLAAMLLMPFGLDPIFLMIMAKGLEWVIAIASHVASWKGDVEIGQMHPWFLPAGTAGLVLLTLLRSRLRLAGIAFLAMAAALFVSGPRIAGSSLLISEDGSLVGVVHKRTIVINRTKPPDFLFNQWKRARRLPEPIKPIVLADDGEILKKDDAGQRLPAELINTERQEMKGANGASFTCRRRSWCAIRQQDGILIVVVEDGRFTGAACDVADLVVSARARFDTCRSGAALLSGRTLRRSGAIEIETAGSKSPRDWRIHTSVLGISRPWTIHRSYDWRRDVYDTVIPEWLDDRERRGSANEIRPSGSVATGTANLDPREIPTASPLSDISE